MTDFTPQYPTKFDLTTLTSKILVGSPREQHIFVDGRNRFTILTNNPGESNEAHWHDDFDEYWIVLYGNIEYDISDPDQSNMTTIHAQAGDLIFCPRGKRHHIRTVGSTSSARLAIATPTAPHVYTDSQIKEWKDGQFS
jgi:mannose-6-phosphate isomerase-like protein (cupin superfamily)